MSKKTIRADYRVVVYPHTHIFGLDRRLDLPSWAEEMKDAIRRHCDDVGSVDIRFDTSHVCGFCGNLWTEASDTYNGGCCDKDEENNPTPDADALLAELEKS